MSESTLIKKRGRTRRATATETVVAGEEGINVITDDGGDLGQVDDEQVRRLSRVRISPDKYKVNWRTITRMAVSGRRIGLLFFK